LKETEILKSLSQAAGSVFVGPTSQINKALIALASGLHLLIEDNPGVGKTTLIKSIAKASGLDFGRIQFTPDLLPGDIIGMKVLDRESGEFRITKGALHHQLILADEINRASPRTQAGLLEAMQEGVASIEGTPVFLPEPFIVMATQNPQGFSGTFELPEAQVDRFGIRLSLGYPGEEDEVEILIRFQNQDPLEDLEPVCSVQDILAIREKCQTIHFHEQLLHYMVKVAAESRQSSEVRLPLSPRSLRHWQRASQGRALMEGRSYVIPEDLLETALDVLCHRLVLRQSSMIKKVQPQDLIHQFLGKVPLPTGLKV